MDMENEEDWKQKTEQFMKTLLKEWSKIKEVIRR